VNLHSFVNIEHTGNELAKDWQLASVPAERMAGNCMRPRGELTNCTSLGMTEGEMLRCSWQSNGDEDLNEAYKHTQNKQTPRIKALDTLSLFTVYATMFSAFRNISRGTLRKRRGPASNNDSRGICVERMRKKQGKTLSWLRGDPVNTRIRHL
jgi:hypothetical protein